MFQVSGVFFHLYTSIDAESVIVITSDNRTIRLNQAWAGKKHYWISQQPFYLANDEKIFLYRYIATFQKGLVKRFFHWIGGFGEGSSESVTEKRFRKLNAGTCDQYDIFHFPGNKESDQPQDLFAGYFFFIEMLCGNIPLGGGGKDFPQVLIECENVHLGFSWIARADINKFLKWIDQVAGKGTWHHVVFICTILGQMVMQLKNYNDIFYHMPLDTADRLLDRLTDCEYDRIPQSSVEMIKSIAVHLLQAGSDKGWLAFLSYFANLFEVNRLLQIAVRLPTQYSDKQFNHLTGYVVDLLVSLEVTDSSKICDFVIDNCSDICCLWYLYRELSVHLPDLTTALSEQFSQRFCNLISCRTRAQKIDLLQLNYWEIIPIEMRIKLADPFVEALHKQIAKDTLSKETIATLRTYADDKDICASERFVSFILCLTQNRNEGVINTLIDILNSERFFATWNSWSYNDKSDICISLLKTMFQFQNPFGRRRFRDKVIQVLEAEKKICETYAVRSDHSVKLALEECVIKLLHNVSMKSIFDAFVDIDTSSQIMQSCYSSLVRDAVKRCGTGGDTSQVKTLLHLLEVREKDHQRDSHLVEFEE